MVTSRDKTELTPLYTNQPIQSNTQPPAAPPTFIPNNYNQPPSQPMTDSRTMPAGYPNYPPVTTHTPPSGNYIAPPPGVSYPGYNQQPPSNYGYHTPSGPYPVPPLPPKPGGRGKFAIIAGIIAAVLVIGAVAVLFVLPKNGGDTTSTVVAQQPTATLATPTAVATTGATSNIPATAITTSVVTTPLINTTTTIAATTTANLTTTPPPNTTVAGGSMGIFGAGTSRDGSRQDLPAESIVKDFAVGDEIFAHVIYDGGVPGVDGIDFVLSGTAQNTFSAKVPAKSGLLTASLGKLGVGNYQVEIHYNGTTLPDFKPEFRVAPAPTPTPIPPTQPPAPPTATPAPTAPPTPTPLPLAAPQVASWEVLGGAKNLPAPIAINGNNFAQGARVFLNTIEIGANYVSRTRLNSTVPDWLPPGSYDIIVVNPDGQRGSLVKALYLYKTPKITGINPPSAPAGGTTTITITGLNFEAGAVVTLGGKQINASYISDQQVRATVPAGFKPGTYTLTVTNPSSNYYGSASFTIQ